MSITSLWEKVRSTWSASKRRTRRRWTAIDASLEDRILLTVSAQEQLFLELINRARANPTAEATRFGISLNEGLAAGTIPTTAVQPLALNASLQTSIQNHLTDLIAHNLFSHSGSNGSTFDQRIEAAGYVNWTTIGENLAYRATSAVPDVTAMVIQEHRDLFVDSSVAGRGHRTNMLTANYKEAGAGVRTGVFSGLNAVMTGNDFGAESGNSFLTGVVITDTVSANNFYDVGEGLGGVQVVVKSGATTVASTTSNTVGGYQVRVPAGTYQVTFSGTGISSPITKTFTIGSLNVKVDSNSRTDVPAAPTVSFSTSTYSVNEAAGTATITVNLSRAAASAVSVRYATSNGTALSTSDYTAATGTLSFAVGETSKTFTVPITNDLAIEATETINLTLSSPVGVTLGAQATAVLSIADNDVPSVSFQTAAKSVTEATAAASFTVLLSAASTQTITVRYAFSGGTATTTSDFSLTAGTLTFTPGQTSKTISFTVVNDVLDENDETVLIALSAPTNSTLGASSVATYTIVDNDVAPTAKIDFRTSAGAATTVVSVGEATTTLLVPITLSAAAGRALTVNLAAIAGGTATSGVDYSIPVGSVTFAAGETSKTLSLTITNDLLDELNETIKLALTSTLATIGTGATVTILDNDAAPTVSFTTATSSARESVASPGTVRVALSAASGLSVTVNYLISATGTTATTADYTLAAGTLTFLPGEVLKTIPLVIKTDLLVEPTETIRITLTIPTNSILGSVAAHVFSILV